MLRNGLFLAASAIVTLSAACGGDLVDAGGGSSAPDVSDGSTGGNPSGPSTVDDGGSRTTRHHDGGAEAGPHGSAPAYSLAVKATKSAPLANGVGITFDGSHLWILASAGDPEPYTLARFDPATSVIDRSLTLPSLFATLGTQAFGIAWDGSAIWISVSGDSNALVRVDATTGAILKTMSSPAMLGPSDLDFDGTNLWLSSGTGDAFQLAPADGTQLLHFSVCAPTNRDNGVAFRAGEVFVGELFGGMDVYDSSDGSLIGSVVKPNGSALTGDEIGPSVFVNGDLVMLSSLGLSTYQVESVQ